MNRWCVGFVWAFVLNLGGHWNYLKPLVWLDAETLAVFSTHSTPSSAVVPSPSSCLAGLKVQLSSISAPSPSRFWVAPHILQFQGQRRSRHSNWKIFISSLRWTKVFVILFPFQYRYSADYLGLRLARKLLLLPVEQ